MFRQEEQEENHFWMSYTDLVTGFLIIFIIIMFILYTENSEQQVIQAAYGEMEKSMIEQFESIENITISDEATVRFIAEEGNELFEPGRRDLTDYFKELLNDFIPIYLEELHNIYSDPTGEITIKEVRIEGHTDLDGDYFLNLELSSNRARKVQEYMMRSKVYRDYDCRFRSFLTDNFLSCGYSFAKLLDSQAKRTDVKSKADKNNSRRVEFRVLLEYQKEEKNEN
jgi:outer membrane protein OmpA-like peptidoglycan-associated protein